ncbi:MAG: hypothetical protein FWE13_06510 [Firmicutes bacterium]|nr:hypothetical protein [Bacillota bacterium]
MYAYDENNQLIDEDYENKTEIYESEGYSVVDAEEVHIDRTELKETVKEKEKKEENYDDGETVEASVIPEDEQTVLIDKPKVSGLSVGDSLTLKIESEKSILVQNGDKKVGELKPAYCQKLFATRKGQYMLASFHASTPLVMVKLKFFARPGKNRIKIESQ